MGHGAVSRVCVYYAGQIIFYVHALHICKPHISLKTTRNIKSGSAFHPRIANRSEHKKKLTNYKVCFKLYKNDERYCRNVAKSS